MKNVVSKLRGDDRRSIGQSNQVATDISENPGAFSLVFAALFDSDPLLRMRAADAIEKASAQRPELLQPFKRKILHEVAAVQQQEVRWHVAQMLPRLRLTPKERHVAVDILFEYLQDKSSIVKTFAMQALADLTMQDHRLLAPVFPLLEHLADTNSRHA